MNNTGHTRDTSGWVEREWNHLSATYDLEHSDSRRAAYRRFRRSAGTDMHLLLARGGSESDAFLFESVLLHHFPVQLQTRPTRRRGKGGFRHRPHRWQRIRARRFSADLSNNYHYRLTGFIRHTGAPPSYWAAFIPFKRLLTMERRLQRARTGSSYIDIWAPQKELLAAAFLAQAGAREIPLPLLERQGFHYMRERLLAIREAASTLHGHIRRARAVRNLSQALHRHCGIAPGPLTLRFPRYPDQSPRGPLARGLFRIALAHIAFGTGGRTGGPQPFFARYIRLQTRLVCTKAPTLADLRINCRKIAR